MNSNFDSNFLWAVCQVGAEPALKKEFAREYPQLRFAFSRPGFVTFKGKAKLPADFSLQSVFARAYGVSLGKVSLDTLAKVSEFASLNRKLRLHLWERDFHLPGEEPLGFQRGALGSKWNEEIGMLHCPFFEPEPKAVDGDWVVDLVVLEENEGWLGYHQHTVSHSPWPGGRWPIELPSDAPSRAYLKLEEAVAWSRAPIKKGDIAVEIGSAPGGASFALLKRGVRVTGIDPGEMHAAVLQDPHFIHLKKTVEVVKRKELPESVQWVLLDMNVEHRKSLAAVERMTKEFSTTLLGVILTVKLNQWKLADQIPFMMERVRRMGMTRVKAAQLASHRREILIFGITRKGMTRRI